MLIGLIATATIAAAIFFVTNGNIANRSNTQAFVAAESGRDSVVAALVAANAAGTCSASTMSASTVGQPSGPYFSAKAQSITGTAPSAWNSGVAPACPTQNTNYIVIQSTGYGTSSVSAEKTTTLSVYQWQVVSHTSQSGTMAGTNGSFHGVGGGASSNTLKGDLVVRTSNYTCSGSSIIDGDLWVLGGSDGTNGGNVTVTGGCNITGNIFANGSVTSNGGNSANPITIGKSIIAGGLVSMDSNGVTVGGNCVAADGATCGQIASGGTVTLSGTGPNVGTVLTTVTGRPTAPVISASNWKHPNGTALTGSVAAAPAFSPPLNSSQNGGLTAGTVYAMTNWIEFGTGTTWQGAPAVATKLTCPANASVALSAATGPVILDYTGSGCAATSGNTTTITLSGGSVPQDAVILVAPGKTMKVQITGSLTGPSSPTSQIFFVHQSLNTGNVATDCGRPSGDSFTTGSVAIAPRIMVYTPCGLNGTWTGTLTGQFYVGGSMTYNGNFTCTPMSWNPTPSPMPNMDCKILGSGGAAGSTTYTLSLGSMVSQAEVP
ncbi:hypothetical protein [Microbacterium sp. Au-Mic1]|uniref:hypothetical protein n=1 Tax=Microbacterium sp. Au-Mic1 TaxID=2906457 RepID=UPI001E4F64A2|nr:hypothetical protein [Microbacterium sp. Au-Mic1]